MTDEHDPHDLERFVTAQAETIDRAKRELRAGQKRSHWMWFVFPQVEGLGSSRRARRYAISSVAEADAYLAHPVLGPRLRECTEIVTDLESRDPNAVFGHPDDLKFRSSMTLFDERATDTTVFERALRQYYDGRRDEETLRILDDWE